ncbi:MAG: UDP-glucose 4-epimerase GalE [Pirellulaceae bacterium]
MNVLITGGAGYVGSHAVRLLEQQRHEVWVFDNLSEGNRRAVRSERLVVGELMDRSLLRTVMNDHRIEAVMHFAASAYVGESVEHPHKYYQNNIVATLSLMEAMREAGVARIVFSSSCATYGVPDSVPITEDESQQPINPYGFTKLVMERALSDYCHAYQWGYAALRYFNAAGASQAGDIGEDHDPESHLIPLILQTALGQRDEILIFGDDYPTSDGTCIRDYIHVDDLATAHLAALQRLDAGVELKLNLGTGRGASVREVINACRQITGQDIPARVVDRRPGDPPELVADPRRARDQLGWQPKHTTIDSIVESAWRWHKTHPQGYPKDEGRPRSDNPHRKPLGG